MDAETGLSKCVKMRQGQLLMQRYKFCYERGNMGPYQTQADVCKNKSLILAGRMKEHYTKCRVCQTEEFWYGV